MDPWKLLIDAAPREGAWNMALDEHLFRKAAASSETFLRFYRWARPTASIGYSQDIREAADLEACRRLGIDVVRRITGGKLVLHHREITYALASSNTSIFTETLRDSYRLISQALMKGLELMGLRPKMAESTPPGYARGSMPCFAFPARDEVEVGGRKIIGSAQKRSGPVFLQHGSVPLEDDEGLLREAVGKRPEEEEAGMTSLAVALGRTVTFDWAVERLVRGFSEFFGAALEPFEPGPSDLEAVTRLRELRYGTETWTYDRPGTPG